MPRQLKLVFTAMFQTSLTVEPEMVEGVARFDEAAEEWDVLLERVESNGGIVVTKLSPRVMQNLQKGDYAHSDEGHIYLLDQKAA